MFSPPNYQSSDSYDAILKRMTQRMRQHKVDDQVLELLQRAYEEEIGGAPIMLSRAERKRLFQQVGQAILADVLGKMDGRQK